MELELGLEAAWTSALLRSIPEDIKAGLSDSVTNPALRIPAKPPPFLRMT